MKFQGRTFSGASFTWWDEDEQAFQRRWIDTFGNVIEGTARMEDYERSDLPAMVSTARFGETWMRHVWYDVTKAVIGRGSPGLATGWPKPSSPWAS